MNSELLPLLNLPRRNPIFTNREQALAELETKLQAGHGVVAISGLSGIGKTQLALEYAHRTFHRYRAVLWIDAKLRDTFNASLFSIATLLKLHDKSEHDQEVINGSVKRWLRQPENSPWLLILDNVEHPAVIQDLLPPPSPARGHILITTQLQSLGSLDHELIVLNSLNTQEGALLLLRRARMIGPADHPDTVPTSEYSSGKRLAEIMGGLPLALDQAGAYIEETACSLNDYMSLYALQHSTLLKRRGGFLPEELETGELEFAAHIESIDTTLSLSIKKIEETHTVTTDILRICALLHPASIPQAILATALANVEGIPQTSLSTLKLAQDELVKLSLLQVNADVEITTISIHPLLQTVLKDRMDATMQRMYAECVVSAVSTTFPSIDFPTWPQCDLWLAQARAALALIDQWGIETLEAAHLLHEFAYYSWQRAFYLGEEHLEHHYKTAIDIQKRYEGEKVQLAKSLHNLALLYRDLGNHTLAEDALKEALTIRTELFGPVHADIAASLNELGQLLYRFQGKYAEAEEPLKQALTMYEQSLKPDHHDLASSLNELGWLYRHLARYEEAEKYLSRALELRKKVLEPEDPRVAQTLTCIGWLYYDQGNYSAAESTLLKALKIQEDSLGRYHPQLIPTLNYLGLLSCIQGQYTRAEELYQRALAIRRELFGPDHPGSDHPDVAQALSNLALLYTLQKRYEEAEGLYLQAQAIRERTLSPTHPEVSQTMNRLGQLYEAQGKYDRAEELYRKALELREKMFGPDHPHVANCLNNLAKLSLTQQRYEEAEALFLRALSIRRQAQEEDHQLVAQTLSDLALLYQRRGAFEKAEQEYLRALKIYQKIFEQNHPDIATLLENYASMLRETGRNAEAAKLEELAQKIRDEHRQANPPHMS